MLKKFQNTLNNFSVFRLFLALFLLNALLIGVAIMYYNDNFLFWQYPFSYAGATKTVSGLPNSSLAEHIYSWDMFLSGILMLGIAYYFYRKRIEPRNMFRTLLSFVGGCGFILAGFSPDDIKHRFHVLGSALVVASLWILATNYLFEIRNQVKPNTYYLAQAVLQIPIFAYAATYFLNMDIISSVLQKFAILGLALVLLYATNLKKSRSLKLEN